MSDTKIGPAAVTATFADASRPVQLLRLSDHPQLQKNWQQGTSSDEIAENDPLATAMWRLCRSSRTFLPDSQRMENMTWRMMAMTLKRNDAKRFAILNSSILTLFLQEARS
jgi:GATA-binding protein, other eukaryote